MRHQIKCRMYVSLPYRSGVSDVEESKSTTSAKQGFADAAYMLACCYHEGVGIRKSYKIAIKWYITADNDVTNDIWDDPGDIDRELSEIYRKYLEDDEFAEEIDEKVDEEVNLREEQLSIENIINTALSGSSDAQ